MTFEEIKALDEQYVMHSYGRFQVAIDHGKGATVWAVDGKEYIDFSAGIGVCSLGYGDPGWVEAVSTRRPSWDISPTCFTPSLMPRWPRSCVSAPECPM